MRPRSRRGVSEVIGALLLIVVVVVAVGSLAYFLSVSEANQLARQTYLTNVQDENLKISSVQFAPNNPSVVWELDNGPNRYYVDMVNSTLVTLNQQNTTTILYYALSGATYNSISKGASVTLSVPPIPPPAACMTIINSCNITFGGGPYTVEPATWGGVIITIQNVNTASSGLYQLKVGDSWMPSWKEVTASGGLINSQEILLGPTLSPLVIPAKGTVNILADLSGLVASYPKNESISFEILTSTGNLFTTSISSPVALAKASYTTQNYQVTERDVVTLDGSQSYSADGSLQTYSWTIDVPKLQFSHPGDCNATAFSTPKDYDTYYVPGSVIEYAPETIFSGIPPVNECYNGPIRATLTVSDANGLLASSQPVVLPADPKISPVGSISLNSLTPVLPTATVFGSATGTYITNQLVGDMVTFTSGVDTGDSATVASNTASPGAVITVGPGLPSAPAVGDTFTVGTFTDSVAYVQWTLTVQVNDIFGNPVQGATVFFVPVTNAAGNPFANPAAEVTSPAGQAATLATGVPGEVVDVQCGNLPPIDVVL